MAYFLIYQPQAAVRDFLAFHVAKLAFEATFEDGPSAPGAHNNGNDKRSSSNDAAFLAPNHSTDRGGAVLETSLEVVTGKGLHSKGTCNASIEIAQLFTFAHAHPLFLSFLIGGS